MKLTKSKLQQIIKEELALSMDDIVDMPDEDYSELADRVQKARSLRRKRGMIRGMSNEKVVEKIEAALIDADHPETVMKNLKSRERISTFLDAQDEKLGAIFKQAVDDLERARITSRGAGRSEWQSNFDDGIEGLGKVNNSLAGIWSG